MKTKRNLNQIWLLCAAILLLSALAAAKADQYGDYGYTTSGGAVTITNYTGAGDVIAIPDAINGLPVTAIRSNAFYGCESLTSVTMGTNVTSIGVNAFA
jgi:hypothetical protein